MSQSSLVGASKSCGACPVWVEFALDSREEHLVGCGFDFEQMHALATMALRRWNILFGRNSVHEATRRAWCRLLFVLAGALPVLATFLVCCAERVPAFQRARVARYSQLLSQLTGIDVQVERVELLTPTQRWLHGVTLSHPETGVPLGQIKGLWISESAAGCAIHAHGSELMGEQLSDCYRLLHEQVLCRPSAVPHAMLLWMNDLAIHSPTSPPLVFSKMRLELKRQPLSTSAGVKFRLVNVPEQEASMSFARHHDQAEPVSHWTLDTGDQALPGAWVQRFASGYSIPGASSAFTGSFDLRYNQSFWNLSGAGRMHRVDATAWFARPLLSGLAYVDVTNFSLTDQGLDSASGTLSIEEGRIHSDLLVAAKDIGIALVDGPALDKRQQASVLPFRTISSNFKINSDGLRIEPLRQDNVVAFDAVGPIARLGPYSLIPTNNLAVCICNTASSSAERSSTFSRVIQWLPRPDAATRVVPANYQVSQ